MGWEFVHFEIGAKRGGVLIVMGWECVHFVVGTKWDGTVIILR